MEALELEVKPQTSEIAVIADKINIGLEAFEQKKAELMELKERTKDLKITSIDDKASIALVSTSRKQLKAVRVEIEKQGKSMRDPLTTISKAISAKEKELVGIIEPIEQSLLKQELWVEQEKEKIRQAEIDAENKRIQDRIDALAAYGFAIEYSDIKSMTDETFDKYLAAAKSKFEQEQQEREQAERLRLEEETKLLAEQEAERQRIAAEREELEKLRAQQAEAQRIIDEKNAQIAAEERRQEEERLRIEAEKKAQAEAAARAEELRLAQEKAAEEARLKAIQDAKDLEAKRIETERKQREAAERKAARAPDKHKIEVYIADVMAVSAPEMKTEEGRELMTKLKAILNQFVVCGTEHLEQL